jgi:hypothetical protein
VRRYRHIASERDGTAVLFGALDVIFNVAP